MAEETDSLSRAVERMLNSNSANIRKQQASIVCFEEPLNVIQAFCVVLQQHGNDADTWVDVQGLGNEQTLRAIAQRFGFHDLLLEDVVHVPQRPKAETYDNHLSLIVRMLSSQVTDNIQLEQVSKGSHPLPGGWRRMPFGRCRGAVANELSSIPPTKHA